MKKQITKGMVVVVAAMCFTFMLSAVSFAAPPATAGTVTHKIRVNNTTGAQLSIVNANQVVVMQTCSTVTDICYSGTTACPSSVSISGLSNRIAAGGYSEGTFSAPPQCKIASISSYWRGNNGGQLMCTRTNTNPPCNAVDQTYTCTIDVDSSSNKAFTVTP